MDPFKDSEDQIKAVELKTIPNYDNLVLALKIQEPNWFESLDLLVIDKKGIKKTIDLDIGGDIVAFRIIQIKGFSEPFFEVFDKSHMGNGDYSLFQIKDEKPILVYQTLAVDAGWEGFEWSNYKEKLRFLANINLKLEDETSFVYRNGRLTSSYEDIDGDGFGDITLKGYKDFYHTWQEPDQKWYEDDKRELIATEPLIWQIKYNKRQGKFVEWMDKRSLLTNKQSKAMRGRNIRDYYKVIEDNKGNYRIIMFNKEHQVGVDMEIPKEPYLTTYDNQIISLKVSTGSPSNYTFFYDIETNKQSPTYFNLHLFDKGKVVYMEEGKLIVADAFDKKVFYREIKRNFSPVASPSSDLVEAKFIESNKLKIKYLEGPKFTERQETIDLGGTK